MVRAHSGEPSLLKRIMKISTIGVPIYQSFIKDEFYNFLLNEYLSEIKSYEKLHQNGNYFGGSDYIFVKDSTRNYVESNILYHVNEYISTDKLKLMNQWINVQAHDGFLPIHDHSGNISYVIYLKIPEYLKNYEDARKNDIPYSEGAIQFIFGHKTSVSYNSKMFYPEEKMILMFPSELCHYVYPFKDRSSLRVSISGNLSFLVNDAGRSS